MTRVFAALLFSICAASAQAQSPALKSTVLVSSDIVRIADIVANADADKADIAIFRAPDLGQTGTVRVAAVIEALRPHDVEIETRGLSEISVTRASRMIGASEIKRRIAEIAAERLRIADLDNIAVTLDAPVPMLHLDPAESGPLMPQRMTFEHRTGRFDISFSFADSQLRVTGKAQETQDAVILTRTMARGDVLRDSDLAIEKRPKTELQGDVVGDIGSAVGMALQVPLRAGHAIRTTDLTRPQLVKRGEPVMLVYEVPGISLTARGKAEEVGSLGDTINVLNVQSKRIIQGVVSGPAQVTVTSLTPRITSAAEVRSAQQIAAARTQTKAE